jgi:hypothetical protein
MVIRGQAAHFCRTCLLVYIITQFRPKTGRKFLAEGRFHREKLKKSALRPRLEGFDL